MAKKKVLASKKAAAKTASVRKPIKKKASARKTTAAKKRSSRKGIALPEPTPPIEDFEAIPEEPFIEVGRGGGDGAYAPEAAPMKSGPGKSGIA